MIKTKTKTYNHPNNLIHELSLVIHKGDLNSGCYAMI